MRRGLARNTRALIAANGYRRTGVSMAESDGCLRRFDTRIVLPSGTEFITLPDAIRLQRDGAETRAQAPARTSRANALTPPGAEPRSDCLG